MIFQLQVGALKFGRRVLQQLIQDFYSKRKKERPQHAAKFQSDVGMLERM